MPFRINILLYILGDGKWQKIDHVQQSIGLSDHEMQEITRFLSQYDFVELDDSSRRVRINRNFKRILANSIV